MKKNFKLLVIIDPTTTKQPVLSRAIYLAKALSAEVELFFCDYHPVLGNDSLFDKVLLKKAKKNHLLLKQQWLKKLAKDIAHAGIAVSWSTKWGKPLYREILNKIAHAQPDLVLKTTHYHPLLKRLLVTPTDWYLLRYCPVPLWLAREKLKYTVPKIAVAVDPMAAHNKPFNLDDKMLQSALELKSLLQATSIDVLHAYNPAPDEIALVMNEVLVNYHDYHDSVKKQHRAVLEKFVKNYAIPKKHLHLLEGDTEVAIPKFIKKSRINLLVIGTIPRRGIEKFFVGSTVEHLLDKVSCDILAIKPDGFIQR